MNFLPTCEALWVNPPWAIRKSVGDKPCPIV